MAAHGKVAKSIGMIILVASLSTVGRANAAAQASERIQPEETTRSRLGSGYVECVSRGHGPHKRLAQDIAKALRSRKSTASVAFYDRVTKTTCAYSAHRKYDAASMVKPIILGALLLARKGSPSKEEQALARKMIVDSDNPAADALYRQLSDPRDLRKPDSGRIQSFLDAAGMKDTVLSKNGSWGLSQISAADQAKLLRLFTGDGDSVLTPQGRAYALTLMRDVRDDQRWGTPAGAPAGSTIYVKNGWLRRSPDGPQDSFDRGDWKVNSMGAFTGGHYDYGLVVLTENNRVPDGEPAGVGWFHGIDTIEQVSRAVHHDLHPHESPSQGYEPQRPDPKTAGP